MAEKKAAGEQGIAETLRKRTGLQLDEDQIAAVTNSISDVDAIAVRVRKGLQRLDEPAFIFKIPR